jgi:hypothetical protein
MVRLNSATEMSLSTCTLRHGSGPGGDAPARGSVVGILTPL